MSSLHETGSRNPGGEVWGEAVPRSWLHLCISTPVQDSGIDIGDITARKALRKQLQCKTFRWYLVSVYPEMRMYSDIIAYGVVRSQPLGVSFSHRQRARPERVSRKVRSLSASHVDAAVDLWTRGQCLELRAKQPCFHSPETSISLREVLGFSFTVLSNVALASNLHISLNKTKT